MRHLKTLSAPQLSLDGTEVLFTVTESTADGVKSRLWLAPVNDKERAQQLTFGPPADKRGEHTQLFRLDLRSGETQPFALKVAPVVDMSKEKDAIPPPDAEKNGKEERRHSGAVARL